MLVPPPSSPSPSVSSSPSAPTPLVHALLRSSRFHGNTLRPTLFHLYDRMRTGRFYRADMLFLHSSLFSLISSHISSHLARPNVHCHPRVPIVDDTVSLLISLFMHASANYHTRSHSRCAVHLPTLSPPAPVVPSFPYATPVHMAFPLPGLPPSLDIRDLSCRTTMHHPHPHGTASRPAPALALWLWHHMQYASRTRPRSFARLSDYQLYTGLDSTCISGTLPIASFLLLLRPRSRATRPLSRTVPSCAPDP